MSNKLRYLRQTYGRQPRRLDGYERKRWSALRALVTHSVRTFARSVVELHRFSWGRLPPFSLLVLVAMRKQPFASCCASWGPGMLQRRRSRFATGTHIHHVKIDIILHTFYCQFFLSVCDKGGAKRDTCKCRHP